MAVETAGFNLTVCMGLGRALNQRLHHFLVDELVELFVLSGHEVWLLLRHLHVVRDILVVNVFVKILVNWHLHIIDIG